MFLHLVLFKIRPDATPAQLAAAERGMLAMKDAIPEVRDIRWGPNHGPSAAMYSHMLLVWCDDMAAVQRYLDHPVHRQTVAEVLHPIRLDRLAADVDLGT